MHANQAEHDHYDLFARYVHSLTEHPHAELRGLCPFHDDHSPSWSGNRSTGLWRCFGCNAHGNSQQFADRVGERPEMGNGQQTRKIVATYPYHDEHGAVLFEVVRFSPKGFAQRRPDGNGGWSWNLNRVRRVLYHLPEILTAKVVFVTEGEKDADRLRDLDLIATTCPGGAGQWRDAYSQALAGKQVAILPDNDEPGEQHALRVARSLVAVAQGLKVLRLSGLPAKGDVSDWLDGGHTREELLELLKKTPLHQSQDGRTAHHSQRTALTLTRLGDLLNEPQEQVDWLVDNLLPASGFSLLVAKPKAGKSTLARNLALAVAQERDFFNRPTQQGPVLYLALEEKRSEVRKHFKEMGATGEEEVYIYAASAPADALQQIRVVAEEKKPALIIIDPLFRLTRVKDSNDYAQVTAALEPLLILPRETKAHVLCVHHAGKGNREGGDSILGSTAIFAAVDTALLMKRSDRYRTISSQQRYGEDLPETILRFDPASRTVTLGESKKQEDVTRMKAAIAAFLKNQADPATEQEIKYHVEGNNGVKQTALRELVKDQHVERIGTGKKGDPYKFSLSHFSIYWGWESENSESGSTPREDGSYSHPGTSAHSGESESEQSEHFETWEDEL